MIDTHCHLTDPRLLEQLDGVLTRAADAGVHRLIAIGTDPADDRATVALCHGRPNLRCAIGVHPNYVHEAELADLDAIATLAADAAVIALGEMGLDYFHQFAPRERQRAFFIRQLQIAVDLSLPVVIHSRQAIDDTLAVMADFPAIPAVFHCFTGSLDEARRILDGGYFLGFTGPVTYKKNDELREVVRLTPLGRLLVETDAPYLSPEPMRKQKTNEPAWVMHTAAKVAELKGVGIEELDKRTSANVQTLFGWGG